MFRKLFLTHPGSVDETYFEHMGFALRFAGILALASLAALVHAIIPALCEKTASNLIRKLYARIEYRGVPQATAAE